MFTSTASSHRGSLSNTHPHPTSPTPTPWHSLYRWSSYSPNLPASGALSSYFGLSALSLVEGPTIVCNYSFGCLFVFCLLALHNKHHKVKDLVSLLLCFIIRVSQDTGLLKDATQEFVEPKHAKEGAKAGREHFLEFSRMAESRTGADTQVS